MRFKFKGYQNKCVLTVLLLLVIVFIFLPGCSKTDKGDAPKKAETQVPAKVEVPPKVQEPAKAEVPPKVQEPVKAKEPAKAEIPAKVQGDPGKPPKKAAPGASGTQEHNPDYDP
jgi:hypothetical protein